ncbi:class A beta-lactamase [Pseudonocardia sp. NPDC049635]|uniref:class A beta-lactamase n=1 Tax=Pseudonocardia sp. NPDC049635 TaxID=3155506 RepID=UPI0034085BF3
MTLSRRSLIVAGLGAALAGCAGAAPPPGGSPAPAPPGPVPGLPDTEREFGRRIGVHALDTGTGAAVGHRDGERFLMCSVVKALTAAFVLHRSVQDPGLLTRQVRYAPADLLEYAPVTERHVATGMTVEQLCDAAVTVSDNTAQNLLLRETGSPAELTGWLRELGDDVTRADRPEPALNEHDGDLDTSTPAAIAATLRVLTTGDALPPEQRGRLLGWLRANTTGDRQIRAGVPDGWEVGDKTGAGSLGERNDVGVLFPPQGAPVVLSVFTVADDPDEDPDRGEAAIAAATRDALAALRA